MSDLAGAHTIVTGGGTGIGAAIAARLLEAGAKVTLIGRRAEVLQQTARRLSGEVATEAADVTDADDLQVAVERARERFGPVRVLIANAGRAGAVPFGRISREHWDQMLAVNLTGVYLCVQAVLEDLRQSEHGRIVVVASTAGLKGYAYAAAYSASKHGVIGLMRSLALELAETGITVNAVCPGFTDTDIVENAVEQIHSTTGRSKEQAKQELTRFNPQGRLIQPQEVAEAVWWLTRPEAATMTGQAIAVAGGEI